MLSKNFIKNLIIRTLIIILLCFIIITFFKVFQYSCTVSFKNILNYNLYKYLELKINQSENGIKVLLIDNFWFNKYIR